MRLMNIETLIFILNTRSRQLVKPLASALIAIQTHMAIVTGSPRSKKSINKLSAELSYPLILKWPHGLAF